MTTNILDDQDFYDRMCTILTKQIQDRILQEVHAKIRPVFVELLKEELEELTKDVTLESLHKLRNTMNLEDEYYLQLHTRNVIRDCPKCGTDQGNAIITCVCCEHQYRINEED